MMRYLFIIILISLSILFSSRVVADIAVIVNPSTGITELTKRQVIDIYMGRTITVSNRIILRPYDKSTNSAIRASFYHQLIGRSVASVNAYWARLLFTGRASPPRTTDDNIAMLKTIENTPNSIGYVYFENLNDNVNVVLRIEINE